jgi:hypothetical protein
MAKKTKPKYDQRGGVIVQCKYLHKSPAYQSLTAQSKVLMSLLQMHWNYENSIDYGVREAQNKIPCAKNTASNSFKQLQTTGFISLLEESFFSSRTDSKSRVWKLNWMPTGSIDPSNEWDKIKLTVSKTIPENNFKAQKRYL